MDVRQLTTGDEAALEEQRRLEAKNKFISHGRKGKVTNGLHIEFSADFKPHVSVGRAHVSTRSVSEDGRRDCWRFLEPGRESDSFRRMLSWIVKSKITQLGAISVHRNQLWTA